MASMCRSFLAHLSTLKKIALVGVDRIIGLLSRASYWHAIPSIASTILSATAASSAKGRSGLKSEPHA